jgi:RHS repeat-associated protein
VYSECVEKLLGQAETHNKFAGKERDTESNLDHFGARYNSSCLGRWISPDAVNLTDDRVQYPANTINKYIHGGNNLLKFRDPDGRDIGYWKFSREVSWSY